jgi:putative transposase
VQRHLRRRAFQLHQLADTVKMLSHVEPPGHRRQGQREQPVLGPHLAWIHEVLKQDKQEPKKQRHTANRIFDLPPRMEPVSITRVALPRDRPCPLAEAKLRDADAMLSAGKDMAAVLQSLEVSEATLTRWRSQYGGMKSEEAKRLTQLEDANRRLKTRVADLSLDNQMLKHLSEENWQALPGGEQRPWSFSGSFRSPREGHAR